jgi:hypothetical protein
MAITFGPKLGLLYNSLINEQYYDSLRLFLQSLDALVQGSVINSSNVVPPVSPNPGDAYLLTAGTPSGAWTGQGGNIAVWDAQLTLTGTNNVVPGWIFLIPQAGWIIWNVALGGLYVFNGTSWTAVGGTGANFPTNTDITSMTGIPNTTLNGTGYVFNNGTPADEVTLAATGIQWGSSFNSGLFGVEIANQTWTGIGYTGIGLGVQSGTGATVIGAGEIRTTDVNCVSVEVSTTLTAATVGTNHIVADAPSGPVSITGTGTTFNGVTIGSGSTAHQQLFGFSTYATQTTVGATGSASALPAQPTGYLPVAINGTEFVIPYYANA